MNYTGSKGIIGGNWFSAMMLEDFDINFINRSQYTNFMKMVLALVSEDYLTDSDIVFRGLRIAPSTLMTLTLPIGIAVSNDGSYTDDDYRWEYVTTPNDPYGVIVSDAASITIPTSDPTLARIDVVEIRPVFTTYDSKARTFRDPITGIASTSNVDVKSEYGYETQVVAGTASGTPVAPASNSGWIKLAEITVPSAATTITEENIVLFDQSDIWTNEAGVTRSIGVANTPNIAVDRRGDTLPTTAEQFLDGSGSSISSFRRPPYYSAFDYAPPFYYLDGVRFDTPHRKWSDVGMYGFFEEYTNEIYLGTRTYTNATSGVVGDWTQMIVTASSSKSSVYVDVDGTATGAYQCIELKLGSITDNTVRLIFGNNTTDLGSVSINMSTGATSTTGTLAENLVDVDTDEGVARIRISTSASNSATNTFRFELAMAASDSAAVADDFIMYRRWMAIPGSTYEVPYADADHLLSGLSYNYNWDKSASVISVEGWAYAPSDAPHGVAFILGDIDGDYIALEHTTGNWAIHVEDNGSDTSSNLTTQPTTGSIWHFRMLITSDTSVAVYVNGTLSITASTNVPDLGTLAQVFRIGSASTGLALNGYLCDVTIHQSSDVSTTHYTSGRPYHDGDKLYGKQGDWSIGPSGIGSHDDSQTWGGSERFVSESAPSDDIGKDGDFWFVLES